MHHICKCKCKCRDWEDKHTCPLYIAFCSGLGHQHTKGADGSRYQSIYEPTEPSQPMMSDDVSDEDRPPTWVKYISLYSCYLTLVFHPLLRETIYFQLFSNWNGRVSRDLLYRFLGEKKIIFLFQVTSILETDPQNEFPPSSAERLKFYE